MARTKDLWYTTGKDAEGNEVKIPTKRHPDNGGSKKAKRWLACWIGTGGKELTKAFAKKVDADKHGIAMEADHLRGVAVDHRRGRMLLREYAEEKWLPSRVDLRTNSTDTYVSHLRTHIYPALGSRRMNSLERSDMKAFVAKLKASGLAPSTIHTVYAVLRSMLQAAIDDKIIAHNPCSRVPLPEVSARVVEPLPTSAVVALAEAITPRYRLAVWLAAGLGLREGEALGLTVPRVDFLRRRVHVLQQMQNGELVEPKTESSTRVIPADDFVLSEITAHMQRYEPGPNQVIITNRLGKPVQRSSFGHCWREAVEAAGLPRGTRFHDLRHWYASSLIAANLNPKVIQARLGHKKISETMDTYGHLFPDDEDLGRGAIESKITHVRRNTDGTEAASEG